VKPDGEFYRELEAELDRRYNGYWRAPIRATGMGALWVWDERFRPSLNIR
jgi:hypothetical protein